MQQSNRTRLPAPAPPNLPPRELQRDVGLRDVGVPVGHLAAVAHRARLGVVGRHELHLMGGGRGRTRRRGVQAGVVVAEMRTPENARAHGAAGARGR